MADELKYIQAIDFEISLGCPLVGLHMNICPVSDQNRWNGLPRANPLSDDLILLCCVTAYHELGFRGWVLWHYFNEPLLALNRIERLIPRLKQLVPEARTALFTNGERLPQDLNRLLVFDKISLKNYTGRDVSRLVALHPNIAVDPKPELDARMQDVPRLNADRRCRRMWDELIIDFYGNGHICTGDWRGAVPIGNVWSESFADIVTNYMSIRARISQEPMAEDAPGFCRHCTHSMREGDCIIDADLFAEISEHRGF
jgi:hypothetical protein